MTRPKVQFRFDGAKLRINCQEHQITILGKQQSCPNYVFSVENEKEFSIDDAVYKYERATTGGSFSYEIPNHINVHLGLPKVEVHALTAEQIQEMEKDNKQLSLKLIGYNEDEKEFDLWDYIFGGVDNFIRSIGHYIAIAVGIFLLYLIFRPRRNIVTHLPTGVPLLLIIPLLVYGNQNFTHKIRITSNAIHASKNIEALQRSMLSEKCNYWHLRKDHDRWMHGEGNYAVSLSCPLANLNITCPCESSDEIIPVVRENKLSSIYGHTNTDCPGKDLTTKYAVELDLFDTASEYLCRNSYLDAWSREHYGQLIASGCILAKQAFNCHCHGDKPHKNIYRDLLTTGVTQSNLTGRIEECKKQNMIKVENQVSEKNTLYGKLFNMEFIKPEY